LRRLNALEASRELLNTAVEQIIKRQGRIRDWLMDKLQKAAYLTLGEERVLAGAAEKDRKTYQKLLSDISGSLLPQDPPLASLTVVGEGFAGAATSHSSGTDPYLVMLVDLFERVDGLFEVWGGKHRVVANVSVRDVESNGTGSVKLCQAHVSTALEMVANRRTLAGEWIVVPPKNWTQTLDARFAFADFVGNRTRAYIRSNPTWSLAGLENALKQTLWPARSKRKSHVGASPLFADAVRQSKNIPVAARHAHFDALLANLTSVGHIIRPWAREQALEWL